MTHVKKVLFRRICIALFALSFVVFSVITIKNNAQAAPITGFEPGRIIDDDVFTSKNSMNAEQIQAFFNAKGAGCTNGESPCLKNFYEGGRSAAQIIYDTAQQYNINPQTLIVLLQKEVGLVTANQPGTWRYTSATGYGCPDSTPGVCNANYKGFTNQVRWAATMYNAIMTDSPNWYTPYVLGNNTIRWNPTTSCGSSTVNIENRATKALYNYTPYRPNQAALNAGYGNGDSCSSYGNRNFYAYFTDWFGSTRGSSYYTCKNGSNIQGVASGQKILRNQMSAKDNLSLVATNNTGTACAEVHTWVNNNTLQAWLQHIGTNSYTFNPSESTIISAQAGNTSRFFKIDYRGTSSGRLEIHGWDNSVQHWISHTATLSGTIDPETSELIAADTDGNGISEFYIVNYKNTGSGMVEVHGLSQSLQQWTRHTATNLPVIDPTKGRIIAADTDGNGRDEFTYVKFDDAQSGSVEIHTWTADLKQWIRHAATNLPAAAYNRLTDGIIVADTQGDSRDELSYVKYSNTQSGRVEVHGWSSDQTYWISHIATSSGAF